MTNHPNRSKGASPAKRPSPEQIRAAREAAGHTQTEAASAIHATKVAWQKWEYGERAMHPAFFELYLLKTGVKNENNQ